MDACRSLCRYIFRKSHTISNFFANEFYDVQRFFFLNNFQFIFSIRGLLTTSMVVCSQSGLVIALLIGNYFSIYANAKLSIVLILIFSVLAAFIPETPAFLVKSNRISVWNFHFYKIVMIFKYLLFAGSHKVNSILSSLEECWRWRANSIRIE